MGVSRMRESWSYDSLLTGVDDARSSLPHAPATSPRAMTTARVPDFRRRVGLVAVAAEGLWFVVMLRTVSLGAHNPWTERAPRMQFVNNGLAAAVPPRCRRAVSTFCNSSSRP